MAGSTSGYTDGAALSAKFYHPCCLSADEGGNVFIADVINRIRRVDWVTRVVSTVAGNGASTEVDGVGIAAGFYVPWGLTIKDGSIWVTDIGGGTVRHIGMIYITIQIYFNKSLNHKFIFSFWHSAFMSHCWYCTPWRITM